MSSSKSDRRLAPIVNSTVVTYVHALLNSRKDPQSRELLRKFTRYQEGEGAIGSGSSNVTDILVSGVDDIKRVIPVGQQGIVLFGNKKSPKITHIGMFNVLGQNLVEADWTFMSLSNHKSPDKQ